MHTKSLLSLAVWDRGSVLTVAACCLPMPLLPWLLPSWFFSVSSVVAGMFGAWAMIHMQLHGWSVLRGTFRQRAMVLAIWVGAVTAGGLMAECAKAAFGLLVGADAVRL